MVTLGESPGRQIEAIGVVGIYCESIRSVRSRRHRNTGPVFGSVRGTIECSIAVRPDTSIFRAARNQEVKHTVAVARNSPGEWLFLRDAGIFQFPTLAAVGALVHAAAESSDVENPRVHGAGWIQKNVRGRGWFHPIIRLRPRAATVHADAHATAIFRNSRMSPHFGPRKIVSPTVHAPRAAFHLRIKNNPVGRVRPVSRNTFGGTHPGLAAVFAAEKANVGCRNKLTVLIERIEVVAVCVRNVETCRRPTSIANFL